MMTVTQLRTALEKLEQEGHGELPVLRVQGGVVLPMNPPAVMDVDPQEFDTSLADGVTRFVTIGS